MFGQRGEWVDWALNEVLPQVTCAIKAYAASSEAQQLAAIRKAIIDYHWALDMGQDGLVAGSVAIAAIERVLGMPWQSAVHEQRNDAKPM
ncbi:MAG: hypothetical protein QM740_12835 [Acidovorax sp.]